MQNPATAIMLSTVIRAHCKSTDVKYRVGQKTGLFFESLKLPYMLT